MVNGVNITDKYGDVINSDYNYQAISDTINGWLICK